VKSARCHSSNASRRLQGLRDERISRDLDAIVSWANLEADETGKLLCVLGSLSPFMTCSVDIDHRNRPQTPILNLGATEKSPSGQRGGESPRAQRSAQFMKGEYASISFHLLSRCSATIYIGEPFGTRRPLRGFCSCAFGNSVTDFMDMIVNVRFG
jgi:hypothetical protein